MVFRVLSRLLLLASASVALAGAAAPAARAEPPIWHVHGPGGAELTLFGSVHLLQQSTDWRDPALDADLAHADRLLFEVPLDQTAQTNAQTEAMAKGLLPPGQTLDALLTPAGRERLARVAASLGLQPALLQRLKPWLAEVTVSVIYFQHRGASSDLGVEKQVDARTPPSVTRGALETVSEQIDALAGAPEAEQARSLEETLREIEEEPDSFDKLAAAWARGDVRAIETEGLDDLRRNAPGAYERLVVDRNRHWVGELEALLKGRGRTVAVVGVGHLVGPQSVPALLRRDGYRVEGP